MSIQVEENIIMKIGWGPCHYIIIGLCAMCTVSEATASLIVLVAMTLLACDLNYSNKDVMMLNAVSSLGMAVGSLIFGIVADYDGRKRLIPASMIIIFCASIGLSFSHTYFLISFSIFILGFGAAGNNAVLRIYLIECLPSRKHGTFLTLIDLIWIIGLIFALGISWSLAPSIIRMLGNEFRPSSWRVLVGMAGTPNLIMACGASLLPASPRYLISRRRLEQAMFVLQQMFAINNSQHMANFPSINLNDNSRTIDDEEMSNDNFMDAVKLLLLKIWRRIIFVVSFNFIGHTLLLIAMRLFLFPGCIWLALWITHKFIHCTIKHGDLVSINNQTYCASDFGDITMNFLTNCHKISDIYFKYLLIFSSSFIIGEALLVIVIDIIGRRLSLITSGLVGATSILALAFTNSYHVSIVLSIFFLASYSIMNTVTNIIQLESYPTSVRGTIVGLTSVLPHLLSFFIKLFVQITLPKILYIISGLLIGVTIIALPIKDLTKAPMPE